MFTFPKTSVEELNENKEYPTVAAGDYLLKITEVESQVSQKGNPMIKLTLVGINAKVTVFDYMVNDEKMAWKWHHLFIAIGDENMYIQGQFDPSILKDKIVRAKLVIKESADHGKQNKVKDYLKPEEITFGIADNMAPPPFDDGIDF